MFMNEDILPSTSPIFRIIDPLQTGLSICLFVCISQSQGILDIRLVDSPIFYLWDKTFSVSVNLLLFGMVPIF